MQLVNGICEKVACPLFRRDRKDENTTMQFLLEERDIMLKMPIKGQVWKDQRDVPQNSSPATLTGGEIPSDPECRFP